MINNYMWDYFIRVVMSLSFLGGSVSLIYLFFKFYKEGKASSNWPSVKGEIFESKAQMAKDGEGGIEFIIKYSYEVDGIKYVNDRLFFKTFDLDEVDYTKKYPVGKLINVFYNPDKIEESVLEAGIRPEIQILIFLALLLLVVAYLTSPF